MDILFYIAAEDNFTPWMEDLSRYLPQARARVWHAGDHAPADYALVWRPPIELLQQCSGLKAVFNLGAGVDILLNFLRTNPALLAPHVPLIKLDDAGMAAQMAQYVVQAVLRHFRCMDGYAQQQSTGTWHPLPPREQATHPIGIMGMGALGSHVAATLTGMGFPVRGWSRSPKHSEGVQSFSGHDNLAAFASGLQVLVNMLPLTAETENILNRDLFARLAHGAQLINVARGAHLVEDDLLPALASGQLACASLDVFRQEPLPSDHPFWREPRITITPHISALTERTESIKQIAAKINALEKGEAVAGTVDRTRGY